MTMTISTPADRETATADSDPDLAARFEREALPLRDVLLRGARRLTTNEADAEDLLQDTLLAAYKGFRTFTPGTNIQAWLFRIMQNRWINNFRRKQRRVEEVTMEGFTERTLAEGARRAPSAPHSVEAELFGAIADDDVTAALGALPEGYRLVLYYAEVEGYTYAETAAILSIPPGTVMSRVYRARQRLRIALAHKAVGRGAEIDDDEIAA
ncbi:sigma-70 family RNA polymerase sigma factor [Mycolicibacterium austroafricanum]|uniref:sigma-70 family RNA polymerase sigma factor n=1 Tax=Mycolicibacterium austroafricanum TaxID=39687 RepID=UPI001CA31E2C|nr:sigma-70 family RNA polymerase sigma factor [Mycolicibacterium austroafricanum]